MTTAVDPSPVEQHDETELLHPQWCARGPECSPRRHRSRTAYLHHGHYGDAMVAVNLFCPFGPQHETGVSLRIWAEDLAADQTAEPDHYFVFGLDEAAGLARILDEVVRSAIVPLAELEATARLDRAQKVLTEVMAAERIGPPDDVPRSSTQHQKRAVVPLDVVMRLAAALDPGTYLPVIDPWSDGDDAIVVPRLGDIFDGPGPVEEAVRNIVVLCRGVTRVDQVDRGTAGKVLAHMAACSSIEWAARLDEREQAAVLRRFPEPKASS